MSDFIGFTKKFGSFEPSNNPTPKTKIQGYFNGKLTLLPGDKKKLWPLDKPMNFVLLCDRVSNKYEHKFSP